jgi:hypothetical protein
MKAQLTDNENESLETWNTEMLTRLPAASVHNDFEYNKFKSGPTVSSLRWAQWRPSCAARSRTFMRRRWENIILRLTDVNGRRFSLKLGGSNKNFSPFESAEVHIGSQPDGQ